MLGRFGRILVLLSAIYVLEIGGFSPGLKGTPASCKTEGAELSLHDISGGQIKDDPCVRCICKNQAVVCRQETCEHLDTCPLVERLEPTEEETGVCCRKCKGCSYAGQNYSNDDHWGSNQDACRTLTCKGGVVTMARMQCIIPCSNPQRVSGHCCPVCPLERSPGFLLGGAELAALGDPCVRCQWDSSYCHCYRTACPALDCPIQNQFQPLGRCCPECRFPGKEFKLPGGRCVFKTVKYEHHQSFRPDPCTMCKCQGGSVFCQRFVCPVVHCSKERLYYDPRLCCPRCRDKDPLGCVYARKEYQHGESWELDPCTTCKCGNGETKCVTQPCEYGYGCPTGYRIKKIPGQCCHECEEIEATCTVFGDPHYRTFDGLQYSFQGTCKYILTQQCIMDNDRSESAFTVLVRNDPMRSKGYSWTKHVTVRLEDGIRISLLRGKRVKESNRRLRLPHVKLGVYSVMMDQDRNIVLRVNSVGLKIIWGPQSYLEVAASARYKGRLCGLCGNYNHDISDDYTKMDGSLAHSAAKFAQTWRYGAIKHCKSPKDRLIQKNLAARKKKERREGEKTNSLLSQLAWLQVESGKKGASDETIGGIFGDRNSKDDYSTAMASYKSSQFFQIPALIRKEPKIIKSNNQTLFPASSGDLSKGSRRPKKRRKRRRLIKLCGGSAKWRTRKTQIKQCKLLKSQLFAECRRTVSVGRYYRWCIEDACACPNSGKCHCESLTAYARRCEEANILVKWKHLSSCQLTSSCSAPGSVFTSCAPSSECVATCDNLEQNSISLSCSNSCLPGCACPPGTVFHGKKCVNVEDCPE